MIKKREIPIEKRQEYLEEFEVLKSLDHPNILKIYEYY